MKVMPLSNSLASLSKNAPLSSILSIVVTKSGLILFNFSIGYEASAAIKMAYGATLLNSSSCLVRLGPVETMMAVWLRFVFKFKISFKL